VKNIIAVVAILCAACTKQGTPVQVTGAADDFNVTHLFDKDGCAVYRFYDTGRYHYFTTCGETISTQSERCGKSCVRHYDENIRTEVAP
jgi:hypothetical protein